jgi:heptosyltransferase-1
MDLSENSVAPPGIHRLLIVRLGAMGDIIHTLPAAKALRQAFPQAMIGWVVEERWAELLCSLRTPRSGTRSPQRPLVDRVHSVNTLRWRKSIPSLQTWQEAATALSELRAPGYEVAVDFQGALRSALIARWSAAPIVYGVRQPRENIASMFYTRQVTARGAHVVEQNASIAEAITQNPVPLPPVDLPCDASSEQECDRVLQEKGVGEFAVLNPGAGWGAKRWPVERYAEVATGLAKDGMGVFINFGPGEETLARAVQSASGGTAEPIACSLAQLIALTRRARLFVGGDTGPLHLAAALGVPVVGIYGPTDPARNGPYGRQSIVLRSASSITSHARHAAPEAGLLEISSHEVLAAARRLLGRRPG